MFLILTRCDYANDTKVYVQLKHIAFIETSGTRTHLHLSNRTSLLIRETPEEIMGWIEELGKYK